MLVGYFIVRLDMQVEVKYPRIVGLTALLTFAVFKAIKRLPFLRFLLGMKPVLARAVPAGADGRSPVF